MPARSAFGKNPSGMNSAVRRPHAMNAAMLGIIIPLRKVPKRCTPTLRPPRFSVDVVVMVLLRFNGCGDCGEGRCRGGHRNAGLHSAISRKGDFGEFFGLVQREAGQFGSHVGEGGG